MRREGIIIILILCASIIMAVCKANPALTVKWSTARDLLVPESVMYDGGREVLYVSCVNGKPLDKDGNGFISMVAMDGSIKTLKWVTGMDAPKGMGLAGSILYVTDINRIHRINIGTAKIEKTITVTGAKFLNDIAIDSKGIIYITDMMTNTIHSLTGGEVSTWLALDSYNSANGLFIKGDDLMVGTDEGLLRISLKDKKVTLEIKNSGGIDGLKGTGKGSYIITDWNGKTQLLAKDKEPVVLLDTTGKKINAADIEYIPERKLLLIPTFFDNRVVAYSVKI